MEPEPLVRIVVPLEVTGQEESFWALAKCQALDSPRGVYEHPESHDPPNSQVRSLRPGGITCLRSLSMRGDSSRRAWSGEKNCTE